MAEISGHTEGKLPGFNILLKNAAYNLYVVVDWVF